MLLELVPGKESWHEVMVSVALSYAADGRLDAPVETIAMPIDNALVTSISTKLSACSTLILEAGQGIAPWTVKRNKKSAALAAQQLGLLASDVNSSLVATLVYVCRVVGEAQDAHLAAKEQHEEREKVGGHAGLPKTSCEDRTVNIPYRITVFVLYCDCIG